MSAPRHIVFLVYPEASLLTMMGMLEVCEQVTLEQQGGHPPISYRVSVVSNGERSVPTYFGATVGAKALEEIDGEPIDMLFVCGGLGFRAAMEDARLVDWIAGAARSSARICCTGTGSFLLARAGVLAGRRAVTHWLMNDEFAAQFPDVILMRDLLYLRDGEIWSCAGMGSSIDFALALLEEDAGREFAFRIAQRVLVLMRRSGDQPQISQALRTQAQEGYRFDRLHEWIWSNLQADLGIEALARQVGMSPRNFGRVYRAQLGVTPARAVETIRLEAARDLLAKTGARLSEVARQCGFGDEQRMRRAFARWMGKTPSDFRTEIAQRRGDGLS